MVHNGAQVVDSAGTDCLRWKRLCGTVVSEESMPSHQARLPTGWKAGRMPLPPEPVTRDVAGALVARDTVKRLTGGWGLTSTGLLALQRMAGNKAALIAVQRHELSPSRQGTGDEEDVIERPVQRLVGGFGYGAAATRPVQLWGRAGSAPVQRKGPTSSATGTPKGATKGSGSKGGGTKGSGSKAGGTKADEAKAQAEYKAFVAGGPYRINNFVPDFTEDFGKFDTVYNPGARQLTVNMRVKFTFPDLPVPPVVTKADAEAAMKVRAFHAAYAQNFIGQVQRGWSGKFQFKNVREPASVWGRLNPVSVKINVTGVKSNPHYVMKAYVKKSDVANVSPNPKKGAGTVELYKGDLNPATQDFTGSKKTGPDEVTRLKRNLPKIHFANGSSTIESKYLPDLQYVADYLKRMNRPKFTIVVVGHANKVGSGPLNEVISARRAQNVRKALADFGVTNHILRVRGAGTAGATADGSWRKVDFAITVDKSFSNVQDTTLHEFGHMLGLDDEYVTSRAIQLKHQRKLLQQMLGTSAYGKGQENKYANEVSKVDPLQSASVMYSGNEVRVYHYVTMWQALFNTAATAGSPPTPAFSRADWKVIG
jgi:outer membrane protein OmpA-like peptidoglycan-associated protein